MDRVILHPRSAHGQAAVEYLGMILVVAALVAGIAASAIGVTIAREIEAAICSIAATSCEAGAAPSSADTAAGDAPGPGGGPSGGPPLGDVPAVLIPGVPWDGSISVEGDDTGAGDFEGLYAEVTVTTEQRPCRYDADGRPTVTLGVSGELKLGTRADGRRGGAAVSLDAYVGQALTYEINTDPATAEAIRDGAPPPNPVDPTSLPPGTSIVLDEDTFVGLDLAASYAAMRASLGYRDGRRVSSAVQRVDEDTVRVTVGDADLVAQSVSLGLGTDDVNIGLTAESELTFGQTRQVDLDISTPAGREAYASFVATGLLPDPGSAGVSDAGRSEVMSYERASELGLHVGPLDATVLANDSAGQVIDTTNPDGSHSITQFARDSGVSLTRTSRTDADGNPVGEAQYVVRMQDVAGYLVDGFNQGAGEEPDPGIAAQDVTMTFTDEDFEDMRRRAIDSLVDSNPDLSRADVVRMIEEDGEHATLEGAQNTTLLAIAAARTPADVAQALLDEARGDGSSLAYWLTIFWISDDDDDDVTPPIVLGRPSC